MFAILFNNLKWHDDLLCRNLAVYQVAVCISSARGSPTKMKTMRKCAYSSSSAEWETWSRAQSPFAVPLCKSTTWLSPVALLSALHFYYLLTNFCLHFLVISFLPTYSTCISTKYSKHDYSLVRNFSYLTQMSKNHDELENKCMISADSATASYFICIAEFPAPPPSTSLLLLNNYVFCL